MVSIKHYYIKILMTLTFVSISCACLATSEKSPQTLNILVVTQIAPYVIDIENGRGIDLEIISTVFDAIDYKVNFIQGHFRRQNEMFNRDHIQAVASWTSNEEPNCKVSNPYRYWNNAIIVPRDSVINQIDDLKGHHIATFHGAENTLNGYENVSSLVKSVTLSENSLQAARMVKARRVGAYLGDYVGFYYALKNAYSESVAEANSRVIHYFKKNKQIMCFKDPELRNQFNQALAKLNRENKLATILSNYVQVPD